jgi:hypothetical protein
MLFPFPFHSRLFCSRFAYPTVFRCELLVILLSAVRPIFTSRSLRAIPPSEVDSELARVGLYYNQPEPAIIYTSCQYALQPASDAISKHLGEKHKISKKARRGLKSFIKSLHLPDPNRLSNRDDYSNLHPQPPYQARRSMQAVRFSIYKSPGCAAP